MKTCQSCGTSFADEALFCGCCGTPLPEIKASAAPIFRESAQKSCPICGCNSPENVQTCPFCGVNFPSSPVPEAEFPAPVSAESFLPSPAVSEGPALSEEDVKQDRIAIAGFAVSVFGLMSPLAVPLQLFGLILSLCAGKSKRRKTFRKLGIVLSVAALVFSLVLWGVLLWNAEAILPHINDILNETNV